MGPVALIGFGEVGRILAEDFLAAGIAVSGIWDTALDVPGSKASHNVADLTLDASSSATAAVKDAGLVISAVTAARSVEAARSVADGLSEGCWVLDINSSAPTRKREAAAIVGAAGGRYVEAALMSPISPRRLESSFLLGGPHANAFARVAGSYGLNNVTVADEAVGRAAATKLCRSVIVKGLEALLTESLLAARYYGVERDVLDSLPNVLPLEDWDAIANYFISRPLEHGVRRAEEMEEAAVTVSEAGLNPWMASATAKEQRWAAQFGDALEAPLLIERLDAIRRRLPTLNSERSQA
jgi:3-hydroxyisobutyrate dehydrogenase-like beta-hydroxyacid dehydrogenase